MASQSQVYDEIYAQRASEFINRQRIANEQYLKRQEKEQSKRNKAVRDLVNSASDRQRKIRLHHPCTRRQIGEAVKVHYKSDSVMMFELVNHPGKMLRVNPTGKVEFAPVHDDTAVFELEAMYSGNLYFLCTAYRDHDNALGGKGWYLSMTPQGQLTGNGGKCELAQWLLIEEQPPQPNGIVDANGVSSPLPNRTEDTAGASGGRSPANGTGILASQTNPIVHHADGGDAVVARSSTHRGIGLHNAGADGTFPGVGAGREALMRYFLTESGVKFLMQPEYAAAYALYVNNGALSKILHRPDWPLVANRFVDYTATPLPPLRKSVVDQYLSYSEIKGYFENGFLVAQNLVSPELCVNALKLCNYWLSRYIHSTNEAHTAGVASVPASPAGTTPNGNSKVSAEQRRTSDGVQRGARNTVELTGAICCDLDILALFYASPVVQVVQRLLGAGDVAHPLSARIVTTFPTLELWDSPALFGDKWTIDGFTSTGGHSPYTLLVGVALTDIADCERGNFCVHPGSHMTLLEEYHAQVQRRSTLFSEDPDTVKKLDLGEPTQLLLRAGDVFLCSQRTAYLHSLNLGPSATTIVYFKLSHLDHAVLKNTALEALWVEYKSETYYLESADEAAAETAQRVIEERAMRQRAAQHHQQQQQQKKADAFSGPVAVAVPVGTGTGTSTSTSSAASKRPSAPPAPAAAAASGSSSGRSSSGATQAVGATKAGAGTGAAAKSASTVTSTAGTKPVQPRQGAASVTKVAAAKPAAAEEEPKKKVFTPKQNSILMDLLDVNRRGSDLWDDPLPAATLKPASSNSSSSARATPTKTASAVSITATTATAVRHAASPSRGSAATSAKQAPSASAASGAAAGPVASTSTPQKATTAGATPPKPASAAPSATQSPSPVAVHSKEPTTAPTAAVRASSAVAADSTMMEASTLPFDAVTLVGPLPVAPITPVVVRLPVAEVAEAADPATREGSAAAREDADAPDGLVLL